MTRNSILVFVLLLLAACGGRRGGTTLFPVKQGGYYGYIDRKGQTEIPFRYSRAGCFEGGLAVVANLDNSTGWGYIDHSGKYVIKPVYSGATAFSEGLAFVVPHGGEPQAIDKNGIVKFQLHGAAAVENFRDGLAAYSILGAQGELWGFADKNGNTVIPPLYRAVGCFSSGLCCVMNRNGEWGYINKKGKMAIPSLYQNAHPFIGDQAKVAIRGHWGVLHKSGKFMLPPRYADVDIDGDKYLVKHEGKWGWIAADGGVEIPLLFNDAYPFNGNKFAPVRSGDKWGYINSKGKFIIAPQYDFAFGFDGGLAVVEKGGKYGFIDEGGKYVIEPIYDHLPVDYYIRYFAPTSAFYNVKTDVNEPRLVAYKWLTAFYRMDYNETRKYGTDDTRALLDKFAGVSDMISDSTRRHMSGVMIGVNGFRQSGDRAIVYYTLSDNRGKEQMLFLVKVNKKWLVQFTKNEEETPAENDEEITE
jgi:hypothetical protein